MPQLGIWARNDRPPCFECGALSVHDHHVVPRSRGGTKTVPLCESCHGKVHGRRLRISLLTKIALGEKKARGEYAGGSVAYGQQVVEGRLAPAVREQDAITLILDLRQQGRTLREIAAELTERGIETKRGGRWHIQTVKNILARATASR